MALGASSALLGLVASDVRQSPDTAADSALLLLLAVDGGVVVVCDHHTVNANVNLFVFDRASYF